MSKRRTRVCQCCGRKKALTSFSGGQRWCKGCVAGEPVREYLRLASPYVAWLLDTLDEVGRGEVIEANVRYPVDREAHGSLAGHVWTVEDDLAASPLLPDSSGSASREAG